MEPSESPLSSGGFEPNSSHLVRNVLLIVFFIIVVLIGIDLILIFSNLAKKTNESISSLDQTQANVLPQTDYENPFDENTQYVNPFSTSQNPFDSLVQ